MKILFSIYTFSYSALYFLKKTRGNFSLSTFCIYSFDIYTLYLYLYISYTLVYTQHTSPILPSIPCAGGFSPIHLESIGSLAF